LTFSDDTGKKPELFKPNETFDPYRQRLQKVSEEICCKQSLSTYHVFILNCQVPVQIIFIIDKFKQGRKILTVSTAKKYLYFELFSHPIVEQLIVSIKQIVQISF